MPLALRHPPTSVLQLFSEGALYKSISLTMDEMWNFLCGIADVGLRFDAYCPSCKQSTTYSRAETPMKISFVDKSKNWEIHLKQVMPDVPRILEFSCARKPAHSVAIFLQYEREYVQIEGNAPVQKHIGYALKKIGQYPEVVDLEQGKFAEYEKVLSKSDLRELKRASGLVTHGVGIGSFVYLRRIFERLIEAAHQRAVAAGGFDEDAYGRARMTDKIALLKHELPEFMVKHAGLYGILSKGVHELSEQECLDMYNAVEGAIFLMLDDARALQIRRDREKEIAQKLGKIQSALGRNGAVEEA